VLEDVDFKNDFDDLSDLPPIPAFVYLMDGQKIDTSSSVWTAYVSADGGKKITINWSLLESPKRQPLFTKRAWYIVRLYLADRVARKNIGTVLSMFKTFQAFEKWLASQYNTLFTSTHRSIFDWSDFTEGIFRSFLTRDMENTTGKGIRFTRLHAFYRWGTAQQYPDFDSNLMRVLQSIRVQGNVKGQHVRFHDEKSGPLSPDEQQLVRKALNEDKGKATDRAVVRIHFELGLNPNATTRLKNKHLKRYEVNNTVLYHLDVPRVKKRTIQLETKRRPISNKLGHLLEDLQRGGPEDPLLHWLPPARPEDRIWKIMHNFAASVDLISPRTKERLILHPRRFRYTLATHMAEEGASKLHIAEVLDHSDTQSVNVYVETTSSIIDSVEKATDPLLIPLVKRFQGKIVDSLDVLTPDGLPNQMIPNLVPHLLDEQLDIGGIGICGRNVRKDGLCQLFPPLSCYLCKDFVALRAGPHQEMLAKLEKYIHSWKDKLDKRILMQLDQILVEIRGVVAQLNSNSSQPISSLPSEGKNAS
jgi:integrase